MSKKYCSAGSGGKTDVKPGSRKGKKLAGGSKPHEETHRHPKRLPGESQQPSA